ncbi:hypothetical protein ACF3N8_07180 [Staphylococcus massiliensis]|uniref:hypothetical protein n=1 Tax=Staphylococcus massiliensis TaxID=555791 RepID=UPI001EE0E41E|nr:hypothetical protein [Staphylococcus massiliensis]MCG3400892.1 hypothetical protein [Staphylococcus massiliensis]MCG3411943.1 hypothetical protein [Staphylococcus massiliensis]
MSDIIPFPHLKEKLIRDIKSEMDKGQYEEAYDSFMEYERHYEMSDELALKKCDLLYKMEAFLELREETSILLNKGIKDYDHLIYLHVLSLYELKQYFIAIEIIDQIMDEVVEHKTRLKLLPIKDQAEEKLEHKRKHAQVILQDFENQTMREQIQIMLTLIDDNQFLFKHTVAELLTTQTFHPNVMSIMLEYLRFATFRKELKIQKLEQTITVVPSRLPGIEKSQFKTDIIPEIVDKLEDDMPSILTDAFTVLNTHAILMYPLDIYEIFDKETWINGYVFYFEQMVDHTLEYNDEYDDFMSFIKKLESISIGS